MIKKLMEKTWYLLGLFILFAVIHNFIGVANETIGVIFFILSIVFFALFSISLARKHLIIFFLIITAYTLLMHHRTGNIPYWVIIFGIIIFFIKDKIRKYI